MYELIIFNTKTKITFIQKPGRYQCLSDTEAENWAKNVLGNLDENYTVTLMKNNINILKLNK